MASINHEIILIFTELTHTARAKLSTGRSQSSCIWIKKKSKAFFTQRSRDNAVKITATLLFYTNAAPVEILDSMLAFRKEKSCDV